MICVDNQPIAMVEDVGFTRLMKTLRPRYLLPKRKYFTEKVIPQIKEKIMSKINSFIAKAEAMSFTTDIWTNVANKSFMSITCHGIDDSWEPFTFVLAAKPFPDAHTAMNIKQMIVKVST